MLQGLATSKIPRLAALTLAFCMVAGCAGTATTTATMVPTGAPTRTANPVPTVAATRAASATPHVSPTADLAPLAASYTTIAAGGTAAVRQCDREKAAGSGSLADDKAIARACRDGYVQYIAAMKAVAWSPAQAQANAVVSAAEACDGLVVEMVNAPDWSTFSAAYQRLPAAEDRLLLMADAMRKALGLPPAG